MADDIRPILTLDYIEKPSEDFSFTQFPLLQHRDIGVPNFVRYADDFITHPRARCIGTVRLNIKKNLDHSIKERTSN